MPSGIIQSQPTPQNPSGLAFRAVYESPWGGVNSSQYPTDIPANDFVQCDNLVVQNGVLVTVSPNCPTRPDGTYVFVLDGHVEGAYILYVFNCGNYLCALDQFGNTYTYTNNSGVFSFVYDFVNPLTPAIPYGNRPVQVINSIAYIPMLDVATAVYQYAVYTPGLSYVAGEVGYSVGLHMNVISGYLIHLNVYQEVDGYSPARVSWSAPYGYTQFNPEVVAPTRTGAGYNTLTDSSTEIVGSFSMGNVMYLLRTEGLTQMTPTAVSVQPFDFTTLWTSKFGVGSNFSSTVAQFGNFGFFVSESDIFVFSGAAPQGICGTAKAAIFNDINTYGVAINTAVDDSVPFLSGDVASYNYYNPTPAYYVSGFNAQADLYYLLAFTTGIIAPSSPTNTDQIIVWQYSIERQRWTRVLITNEQLLLMLSNIAQVDVTSCSGSVEVVTVNYSEHALNGVSPYPNWRANTFYSASLCILNRQVSEFRNYYPFKLVTSGMCGTSEPTWDFTPGNTTNDGDAVWECLKPTTPFTPGVAFNTSWLPSTAYALGDIILTLGSDIYNNALVYECTQAGTSGTLCPSTPGIYGTITDGSVIWTCTANNIGFWAEDHTPGASQRWSNVIANLAPLYLSTDRIIEGSNGWSQRPYENNNYISTSPLSCGSSGQVEPTFASAAGATALDQATNVAFTGTLTTGSNIITAVSSIAGLVVGHIVTATLYIPDNTRITAIGSTTVTISENATGSTTEVITQQNGIEPVTWQALEKVIDNAIPDMYLAPFAYINFKGTYNTAEANAIPISFPIVLTLGNEFNSLFQYTPATPFTVVFKQEEFKIGAKPSTVRVVVKARGEGTINVQVGNRTFTPIVVNDSTQVKTYTSSGVFTGECPQLTLSSDAYKGIIVKAMFNGKFSEGEYD